MDTLREKWAQLQDSLEGDGEDSHGFLAVVLAIIFGRCFSASGFAWRLAGLDNSDCLRIAMGLRSMFLLHHEEELPSSDDGRGELGRNTVDEWLHCWCQWADLAYKTDRTAAPIKGCSMLVHEPGQLLEGLYRLPRYLIHKGIYQGKDTLFWTIRGTTNPSDISTNVRCKPAEMSGALADLQTLGYDISRLRGHYAHAGMLKLAKELLLKEVHGNKNLDTLLSPSAHSRHQLILVGHSLGAGVAALIACILHTRPNVAGFVSCKLFATPPVLSKELAVDAVSYTETMVNKYDLVPRLSVHTVAHLLSYMAEQEDWMLRQVASGRVDRHWSNQGLAPGSAKDLISFVEASVPLLLYGETAAASRSLAQAAENLELRGSVVRSGAARAVSRVLSLFSSDDDCYDSDEEDLPLSLGMGGGRSSSLSSQSDSAIGRPPPLRSASSLSEFRDHLLYCPGKVYHLQKLDGTGGRDRRLVELAFGEERLQRLVFKKSMVQDHRLVKYRDGLRALSAQLPHQPGSSSMLSSAR